VSTALWEVWTDTKRPIVVARYNGVRGHPVLFDERVFEELREVEGDVGARDVIARDPERIAYVDWPIDPPRDIDTPADYQELQGTLPPAVTPPPSA
jgi:molybdenum cofactor cytidylyltransferase